MKTSSLLFCRASSSRRTFPASDGFPQQNRSSQTACRPCQSEMTLSEQIMKIVELGFKIPAIFGIPTTALVCLLFAPVCGSGVGSWVSLGNLAPATVDHMLLLSDGTVLAHQAAL